MRSMDIGIQEGDREKIANGLKVVLADSYALYLKTHNYHWNVTGPMFQTLHTMFEAQYTELALAVDAIAERIRSLGAFAPGSFSEFLKLSHIKDATTVPSAIEMIKDLVSGHETLIRSLRPVLELADGAHDDASADILTQRLHIHEKTAWMLRSLLEG